ncbi:hypothetical protein GTP38_11070 [Duganella sp. FT94W]|uniref:Uncharacterized protein n=1 Tax=Duganella lactea TaxID=2692173 RepID=A0ABW9V5P9_9BURK|nr:hypothetical protein [Duganella lactea]MYM34880.1 hypothetical protein [Duganella lactea]
MSICLSVRGALRDLGSRRGAGSYFTDDNGKPLTRLQAIDALHDDLAAGRETIPVNNECANPCPNAGKGCKGFDFGKGGGCPGYWIEPEEIAAGAPP